MFEYGYKPSVPPKVNLRLLRRDEEWEIRSFSLDGEEMLPDGKPVRAGRAPVVFGRYYVLITRRE